MLKIITVDHGSEKLTIAINRNSVESVRPDTDDPQRKTVKVYMKGEKLPHYVAGTMAEIVDYLNGEAQRSIPEED